MGEAQQLGGRKTPNDSGSIIFQHQMDGGSIRFFIFKDNSQTDSAFSLVLASALQLMFIYSWLANVLCNINIISVLLLLGRGTSFEGQTCNIIRCSNKIPEL